MSFILADKNAIGGPEQFVDLTKLRLSCSIPQVRARYIERLPDSSGSYGHD